MKPCDNPKFNEMWQKMMRQLDSVLTAAHTDGGFNKLAEELIKFDGLKADFEKEILFPKADPLDKPERV